jgi:hypothetical protein
MGNGGGARVYQLPRMVHPVEKPLVRFRVLEGPMPLFDALAEAGGSIPDSEVHRGEMMTAVARFQEDAGAALEKAIKTHAERYDRGFYKSEEGKREEIRFEGNLSLAMHLMDCVNGMWPAVLRKNDAGTSSLFETAFRSISSFLGESYYQRQPGEVYSWYVDNEPLLSASLRRCGMEDRAMSLERAIETNIPRLVDRTLEAYALL